MKKRRLILVFIYTILFLYIFTINDYTIEDLNHKYSDTSSSLKQNKVTLTDDKTLYNFKTIIYPDNMLVTEMVINYKNKYDFNLSNLKLNLPVNTFYDIKYINILDFNIEKQFSYEKNDKDLYFNFTQDILPGESIQIYLKFATFLPKQAKSFGHYEGVNMVSNWYPIIPPFNEKEKKWQSFYKSNFGETYNYESSNFIGTIVAPKNIEVISPFKSEEKIVKEEKVISVESLFPVRDFTFVYGENFKNIKKDTAGINVEYYYQGKRRNALNPGCNIIKYYQDIYGKYPYKKLILVDVPLDNLIGMEYSGILFFSTHTKGLGEKTIAHELGHQYWYNLVGSNQFKEAWIDESLATYSSILYLEHKYGNGRYLKEINAFNPYQIKHSSLLSVLNYPSKKEYKAATYLKPLKFWDTLRRNGGKEKLYNFFRGVQKKYRYKIIDAEILFEEIGASYPNLDINSLKQILD